MPDLSEFIEDPFVEQVKAALARKRSYTVEALADKVDASPRRVRDAIEQLRHAGFRIPEEREGKIALQKLPPDNDARVHRLPIELLDGDWVKFGVISDTHLCSNECALDELHLAYDYLEREGITTVLHPGDLVAGKGIFPLQDNFITHHTFEGQRDFAIREYPKRKGITTHIIGGNHDLEGTFGRAGADIVAGVANQREDINYLGPYTAWVELANGAHVHLLHGKGGMSYSFSYKAQKLCEAYSAGRKPAALLLGHYHVQGNLEARGIQVTFPACFEWVSAQFGARVGHRNSVGFHVVEAQLGDDGSIVEWTPRWKPIWQGRIVATVPA